MSARRVSVVRPVMQVATLRYSLGKSMLYKMKYTLLAKLLLFYWIILFFGCDRNPPTLPEKNIVLIPLAVGNNWVLKSTYINPKDSSIASNVMTIKISNMMNVKYQGISYDAYLFEDSSIEGSATLVLNDDNGFSMIGQVTEQDTFIHKKEIMFKYPVSTGEIWPHTTYSIIVDGKIVVSDSTRRIRNIKCVSTNENVKTIVGTFNGCILYNSQQQLDQYFILEYNWYVKPNIGIVRMIIFLKDKNSGTINNQTDIELISYNIMT